MSKIKNNSKIKSGSAADKKMQPRLTQATKSKIKNGAVGFGLGTLCTMLVAHFTGIDTR